MIENERRQLIRLKPNLKRRALGIDRLVMLLCNVDSIDEVITFTVDTA